MWCAPLKAEYEVDEALLPVARALFIAGRATDRSAAPAKRLALPVIGVRGRKEISLR
jgi:hypothetical protein